MLNQFTWVIFPYLCVVVFIVGHIFRFRYDQFNWTAKSSEFIEKKHLRLGSMLFHLGIIPVFFGHVAGLGIPKSWMNAIGVNEHLYHMGAVYGGGLAGVMVLAGMLILTARRFSIKTVRKLSSTSDLLVNAILLFIIFMGVYSTFITNAVQPDFDYRETISVWFRGLLTFSPDASLMKDVPFSFKLHILLGIIVFGLWPFTRLVHVWSVPLNYVRRSSILYRKHKGMNKN